MKKLVFLLSPMVYFFISGCSLNNSSDSGQVSQQIVGQSKASLTVKLKTATLKTSSITKKYGDSILITSNQILGATITLTGTNYNASNNWSVDQAFVYTFQGLSLGGYTLTLVDWDNLNNTNITSSPLDLENGWNYTVGVILGDAIYISPMNSGYAVLNVISPGTGDDYDLQWIAPSIANQIGSGDILWLSYWIQTSMPSEANIVVEANYNWFSYGGIYNTIAPTSGTPWPQGDGVIPPTNWTYFEYTVAAPNIAGEDAVVQILFGQCPTNEVIIISNLSLFDVTSNTQLVAPFNSWNSINENNGASATVVTGTETGD